MYLNSGEKEVIDSFVKNIDKYTNYEMDLIWRNKCQIRAVFDTYFEDENDFDRNDTRYEEYISFAFTAVSVIGTPPVCITRDKGFLINYHNFPDSVFVQGKKIN